MIVAETAGGFRLVTQPDHASLAGQFADRWGNDAFERPTPHAAVALAAHAHDDGWWSYDRRPHLGEDGTPVDFRGMPAGVWTDLYDAGIDDVVELDPYAGLLVSMHGAGLRRRRYGLSPNWPPTQPGFRAFVDRQEALQSQLVRELFESGDRDRVTEADVTLVSSLHETGSAPDGTDSRLWTNYELLQAWDTLSLAFCTTVTPPSYDEVAPVPTGPAGSEETLSIAPLGDDAFRIEPYPFDADPLVVSVPARTVAADAFDDEASSLRAYYDAPRETLTFELRGESA